MARAALLVSSASVVSRVVGVLRDRVLVTTFGASPALDAYYAAFRLPDVIYSLLILGALTAGFIPVFTEYWEKRSPEEAWKLSEQVLSVIGTALLVASVLLWILAPFLIPMTVRGFQPETQALTITLTRIMCLSPFLLGLSAVMGGVLQARRRLFAFALAPVLYNLGIILGALWLSPRWGIVGVAMGVVGGATLHLLAQLSVAYRLGIRHICFPSLRSEGVRRILVLMGPRTLGLAVAQINLVILLSFASVLPAGSISVFTLANNLQSFPIGIIGVSFAIAVFPLLSLRVTQADPVGFGNIFSQTVQRILFFMIPLTAMFLVLRLPLVRLVLGEGRFGSGDTVLLASVLGWFSLSLIAQALIPLFARGLYALQNTWTPLWISLGAEGLNLFLATRLIPQFGIQGLAMAFSSAAFFQVGCLWVALAKSRPIHHRTIALLVLKMTLASIVFGTIAGFVMTKLTDRHGMSGFWIICTQLFIAIGIGLMSMSVLLTYLRVPEWEQICTKIAGQVRRAWNAVSRPG